MYQKGSHPNISGEATYRILEDKEAHDILSQLDKRPMMAGEEDIRISGAGAQDKLIIAIIDGKIAIPKRDTPSTHIIKPVIKGFDDTVQNEFFCMKLARKVGLPVPEVNLYWLEGNPYFLIERYDRLKEDNKIVRLHQEDLCQALHIPPEYKYENEGGPKIKDVFKLLDERIKLGLMAGKNKIIFLQAIIFNFLIGNGDAHGKNFSLLYSGKTESLAPFYDLMSTVVYTNSFKEKMAMKLEGEYKFKNITLKHFEKLSAINGFRPNFIQKQVNDLSSLVLKASSDLVDELNDSTKTHSKIYERIVDIIKENCGKLNPLAN